MAITILKGAIVCILGFTLGYFIAPKEKPYIVYTSLDNTKETIIEIVPPKLHTQGDFVYFEGDIIEDAIPFKNIFERNIVLPEEIHEGYLSVIEDKNRGLYYLWTAIPVYKSKEGFLRFWGFTDNLVELEYSEDKYLRIIYPMVRAKE